MEESLAILLHVALVLAGVVLIVLGVIGSVAPALPGPLLALIAPVGLKLLSMGPETYYEGGWFVLGIAIGLTVLISILENVLPVYGTRRLGGTRRGVWGSTLGLIAGFIVSFIFPGVGILAIIFGPFIGAYIGERSAGLDERTALRSATGSLIGFLAGTAGKLAVVFLILVVFVVGVVRAIA